MHSCLTLHFHSLIYVFPYFSSAGLSSQWTAVVFSFSDPMTALEQYNLFTNI